MWNPLRRRERDLDRELRFHIEEQEKDYASEGVFGKEAHRRTLRDFGTLAHIREACREVDPVWRALAFATDVRIALRRLRKQPMTTLASVLALAFGIGATAATWSLLSAVLLHPLPVEDPARVVVVGQRLEQGLREGYGYPQLQSLRSSGAFEALAGGGLWTVPVGRERPVPVSAYFASHDFFDVLGVVPEIGRGFSPDDDQRGAPLVVVLSHRYWRQAFGGDTEAVGQSLEVSGQPATIVGVAPRGFRGLRLTEVPELYFPLEQVRQVVGVVSPATNFFAEPLDTPGIVSSPTAWVRLVGRLPDGVDYERAESQLNVFDPELPEGGVYELTNVNAAAVPEAAREGIADFSRLLGLTVGLLLLTGCLAVGALLLVRTESRRDEFAMCMALGGSARRFLPGIAIEGGLLALSGSLLALPIAHWLFSGIRQFELPGGLQIELMDLQLDTDAVLAAAAGAIVATLLVTVASGASVFSVSVSECMRSRAGATPQLARRTARTLLVVSQVAVALVLLAGTGLFARSIARALNLNPGVETGRIVTASLALGLYGYGGEEAEMLFEALRERLASDPAIESVSMMRSLGGISPRGQIGIDGEDVQPPSVFWFVGIDEHYFETLGLRVMEGRNIAQFDADAPAVAVVSESLARFLAQGREAIGRVVTDMVQLPPDPPDAIEVVGVVPDLVTNLTQLEPMVLYRPHSQMSPSASRQLVLRASSDPDAAVRATANAIGEFDESIALLTVQTLDEQMVTQMGAQRFGMYVMGGLGGIAAVLVALAVYVIAETMALGRRREMGIRAALGARGWQLSAIVMRESLRLVGLGVLAGLGLAWLGSGAIRALLFRIGPMDWVNLISVSGALLTLAVAVSLKPALAAARVDVASTLREE